MVGKRLRICKISKYWGASDPVHSRKVGKIKPQWK
jgi:hypothetical protein